MGGCPPIYKKVSDMPRFSKNNREEALNLTRQRLLDAAAVEFAQKGFAQANINQISIAAGYSKGTIYNYFTSKQALMKELIAAAGAAHVAYISEKIRLSENPATRLAMFFESGFAFINEHPTQARFLITTLYSPDLELRAAMFHAYQPMFNLLMQELLEPGITRGLFHSVDLQTTTNLIMTIYLGTGSSVDEHGKVFMDPHQVAEFVLHALQYSSNN